MAWIKAELDAQQADQAPSGKPRADQHDEGNGDLSGREQAAREPMRRRHGRTALLEHFAEAHAGCMQRGNQPGERPRDERNEESETKDAGIKVHGNHIGDVAGGRRAEEKAQRGHAHGQARDSTQQKQQHALGEQLAHQAAARLRRRRVE